MEAAMIVTVGAIALLVILSAFFSGSETALIAVSRPRMHQLARKGNRRAAMVERLHDQRERMLGTILLGNNLVNILSSALATAVMISLFGEAGVVYATAAMTVLILIFGEVMPKTYALHNADRMALAIAPVFRVLVAILAPVTHAVYLRVRTSQRVIGVEPASDEEIDAAAETLRGAIELHSGKESAIDQQRAMLLGILDLGDVDVGMIMRHRRDVVAIEADLPPSTIVNQVLESPFTRIPLWRNQSENIIGVLHAKALLRAVQAHKGALDELDLEAVATDPWFIPESTTLLQQLQAFRRRREHFALVVDEYGGLMGVVTLEDIIEEIVGEITDEHDVELVGVRTLADGSFVVDGGITVRDLNRRFEWELPEEFAATIAGLVIHEARLIPDAGQTFVFHGFRFEVLRRQRNRVALLKITPPAPEEVEEAS